MNQNNIHVLSRAVVMDQGHILLCQTLDLPISFYFLPGGHVEHGEGVEDTVLREVLEETGARARIKRFLGCLEHSFEPGHSSICHNHEYNFVFEVESPNLKVGIAIPPIEKHIALVWLPLKDLTRIDFRAEPLKDMLPKWLADDRIVQFQSRMI